jgi:DNA-binding MarR family transcriptional regulator
MVTNDRGLMECSTCLCLASRKAARALTRAFDRELRPHGIRSTQFTILTTLMLRGPTAISELADFLGIERTTLTRNLALLEGEGWVDIVQPGGDARLRIVTATKKGRAAVASGMAAWRKAQHAATAAIGKSGVEALQALARSV